jgi:methyltransferase (TIGR00027 family)
MSEENPWQKASRTASYTCFSRACANKEKDPRLRGPDCLAEIFLPMAARCVQGSPLLRSLFMRIMAPPGIYEYVLVRTKLIDEVFVQALEGGFSQIVLLGAGFDTRALRFADRNKGIRIFELDAPATQQPKIEILHRKRIHLPGELVFVPFDFNRDGLSEVLFAAGFMPHRKNLFVLEGVVMYLTPDAVDATLDFVRSTSAEGSLVVFDYVRAPVLRRENRLYGEKEIFKTVSRAGEGWTFGLEDEEVERFMSERSFEITDHYTPADLEKIFLTAEDGQRLARVNETHCIVVASVSGERLKSDHSLPDRPCPQ